MNNTTKRRKLSSQLKTQLVMEYIKGSKSQAEICRENVIGANLLSKWVRQFQEKAHLVFEDFRKNKQEEKITKLEQIIGKQTIEINFLKRGLHLS